MKKENKNKLKEYGILIFIIVIFALAMKFIPDTLEYAEDMKVYREYKCDGELLNDSCAYAKITKSGGVFIKDCKTGNEYLCQTVTEYAENRA